MTDLHLQTNQRAWASLAQNKCESSVPLNATHLSVARSLLDPLGWLPWQKIGHVLCLASAGGQQGPAFASLGCRVTVFDLSADQLSVDRAAAEKFGYDLELVQGDMTDLSRLHGRGFDLVYQAISALYVPDVERLYREVGRVLRPGGLYRVEHLNPTHIQVDDEWPWDGYAYRLVRPQGTGQPVPLSWWVKDAQGRQVPVELDHFAHTLDQLIGGLPRAGFDIVNFAERTVGDPADQPGSYAHMYSYLPPYLELLARRRSRR